MGATHPSAELSIEKFTSNVNKFWTKRLWLLDNWKEESGFYGGCMHLEIRKGKNLARMDMTSRKGKANPFVKIFAGTREVSKTQVETDTLNPEWNHKDKISVRSSEQMITLSIHHMDEYTGQTPCMGIVLLDFCNFLRDGFGKWMGSEAEVKADESCPFATGRLQMVAFVEASRPEDTSLRDAEDRLKQKIEPELWALEKAERDEQEAFKHTNQGVKDLVRNQRAIMRMINTVSKKKSRSSAMQGTDGMEMASDGLCERKAGIWRMAFGKEGGVTQARDSTNSDGLCAKKASIWRMALGKEGEQPQAESPGLGMDMGSMKKKGSFKGSKALKSMREGKKVSPLASYDEQLFLKEGAKSSPSQLHINDFYVAASSESTMARQLKGRSSAATQGSRLPVRTTWDSSLPSKSGEIRELKELEFKVGKARERHQDQVDQSNAQQTELANLERLAFLGTSTAICYDCDVRLLTLEQALQGIAEILNKLYFAWLSRRTIGEKRPSRIEVQSVLTVSERLQKSDPEFQHLSLYLQQVLREPESRPMVPYCFFHPPSVPSMAPTYFAAGMDSNSVVEVLLGSQKPRKAFEKRGR
eukprot:gnl/MRDRNA2_/MRDRNA2_130679_c0_seq1.p1 gnl/MRDRNA2_/MRDRNA2_130679_c0~~gnl/MRDRNA2_/MRDRNA2_130679_c0_seq1.p1  ORF type:complete len:635 (-),score=107.14 gnl/MRDRNA2_/MRDRNA2_130679_c0_seq1:133-1890(-)